MLNNKWYAIRTIDKEKVNKIIDNWEECDKYIRGHSAIYKLEDAIKYLGVYE